MIFGLGLPAVFIALCASVDYYELHKDGTLTFVKVCVLYCSTVFPNPQAVPSSRRLLSRRRSPSSDIRVGVSSLIFFQTHRRNQLSWSWLVSNFRRQLNECKELYALHPRLSSSFDLRSVRVACWAVRLSAQPLCNCVQGRPVAPAHFLVASIPPMIIIPLR